jgi:hypothetical protein
MAGQAEPAAGLGAARVAGGVDFLSKVKAACPIKIVKLLTDISKKTVLLNLKILQF